MTRFPDWNILLIALWCAWCGFWLGRITERAKIARKNAEARWGKKKSQ